MMQITYEKIREGRLATDYNEEMLEKIEAEVLEEPCEICGIKTGDTKGKRLHLKKSRDKQGRPITMMVCSKCLTGKKKAKK
jgi:hypothetical protein